MSSCQFRARGRGRHVRRRVARPLLQRVLPEHHTTGGSRDMIGAIVGLLTLLCALVTGLLDLDRLRRVRRPKRADPGSGVEGHATRPCAVRLRAGSQSRARPPPGGSGEDHRSGLGRERERQQFRRQQLRGGASEHAGAGKAPGGPPPLDRRAKAGARRRDVNVRCARSRRACRCPSRSPLRSPIRLC